jgi:hypothetical protein
VLLRVRRRGNFGVGGDFGEEGLWCWGERGDVSGEVVLLRGLKGRQMRRERGAGIAWVLLVGLAG